MIDMVEEYGQKVMEGLTMDTLPEGVEMVVMGDSQLSELGSVVGVESIIEYPHHCGSGHTPLLSSVTIPENGVELGCVIGLQTTGVQEHTTGVYIDWRFAR